MPISRSQRAEVARRQEAFGAELRTAVVADRAARNRGGAHRRDAAPSAGEAVRQSTGRSPRTPSARCGLLSQRLVATQEDERKNLSRELHDHVAQVLTALRMELGRIERTIPVASVRADGGGVTDADSSSISCSEPSATSRWPPAQHAR